MAWSDYRLAYLYCCLSPLACFFCWVLDSCSSCGASACADPLPPPSSVPKRPPAAGDEPPKMRWWIKVK